MAASVMCVMPSGAKLRLQQGVVSCVVGILVMLFMFDVAVGSALTKEVMSKVASPGGYQALISQVTQAGKVRIIGGVATQFQPLGNPDSVAAYQQQSSIVTAQATLLPTLTPTAPLAQNTTYTATITTGATDTSDNSLAAPYYWISTTAPALLTSLAITSGPASVNEKSTSFFIATATWSDGSTTAVTPTWSVTLATYASINSSTGVLTTLAVPSSQTISVTASYTAGGVTKTANKSVTILDAQYSAIWTSNGPEGGTINALAIDPSSSQTVYAGTQGGGVFKSTNDGASWSAVISGLTVYSLAIDPSSSQTVYAGSYGCVFKSTNGGGTWSADTSGLSTTAVHSLAIDPSSSQTVYAGTSGGVFKSTNGGASWSAVTSTSGLATTYVNSLASDPSNSQTVYAGTYYGGVFKSTNGGATWSAVTSGLTTLYVTSLAIDPSSSQTVYAGTSGGVFRSTNGGASWNAVNSGLTIPYVQSLAIDPTNNRTVYAGTNGGVFKTTFGPAPIFTGLTISSGPASINEGDSATYSATATWDDGSSTIITPTWSVTPITYAGINTSGLLTILAVPSNQAVTVTASFTAGGVTKTANMTVTITNVNLIPQTISGFNPPAGMTYGDVPITLNATGGASGNPVTFIVVSGPGVASGPNNATLTSTGAGAITLKATQSGNASYGDAPNVTASITVSPKKLTITANNASRVYGTANPANPGFTSSSLAGTDSIGSASFTYAATATAMAAVGTTHAISVSDPVFTSGSASNYAITFVSGALSISDCPHLAVGKVTAMRGETVIVPITLDSLPSHGLAAVQIQFDYDANQLTYVSASSAQNIFVVNGTIAGSVISAMINSSGISTGRLFTVTFRVSDTAALGDHLLHISAPPYVADMSSQSVSVTPVDGNITIVTDITPPTLIVSTLADGSYTRNATLNVSGSASDPGSAVKSVTVNGQSVLLDAGGNFSRAVSLVPGANVITVIATDNENNQRSDTRTISHDSVAPVVTISTPADNSVTALSPITVNGSVDKSATVDIKINNGASQAATVNGTDFTASATLDVGLNTIQVTSTDLAGNSSSAKRTVTYDNIKPTLAVTVPVQDITTNQSALTLQGTVSDSLSAVTVRITMDGQTFTPAVTNGAFQQQLTFTTLKQYAIVVTATNQAGNSSSAQRNIIYQPPSGATVDLGSVSCLKGATITVPLTLTNVVGIDIASVAIDIAFDSVNLLNSTANIGAAGNDAGKTVSTSTPSTGIYRIGILGFNTTPIGNGTLATVSFTCSATAPLKAYTLTNAPSASDAAGETVLVTGKNGVINVVSKPGDCNGDNSVNIAEVQGAINMFLGAKTIGCGVDSNSSNSISIAEVQKVINGYLGM